MACQQRRRRAGARVAVTGRRWIGVVQPKPPKVQVTGRRFLYSSETMNELLNKIKSRRSLRLDVVVSDCNVQDNRALRDT